MAERRVSTAIRFEPAIHEALKETATELGVGVNWLVNKLCKEGLARIDLTGFSLVREQPTSTWPETCPTCGGKWAIKSRTMGAAHGQPHHGRCENGHTWRE